MEPLAPIIDQMRELAREELPSPRTCKVRLWDDDSFDVVIYHSRDNDERQLIRYERTTSEIIWERVRGARWEAEDLTGGETIYEPDFDKREVRVITTVEPPYE